MNYSIPQDLPNARGYIDKVEEIPFSKVRISGWMLTDEGSFDKVLVLIGDEIFEARIVERGDIEKVYPWISNTRKAGFEFEFNCDGDDSSRRYLSYSIFGIRGSQATAKIDSGYYHLSHWEAPPLKLMKRVANTKHAYNFYASGMKTCINFLTYAEPFISLKKLDKVLDWGCGCGRLTPHLLHCLPDTTVHGADIDPDGVRWAASKYSEAKIIRCDTSPPLPHEDDTFDLVLAGSVFTHLTKDYQKSWLKEMNRILKPGGLLIATTHGDFAVRYTYQNQNLKKVFGEEFSDAKRDRILDSIAPSDYYRATFQSRDYTYREWGKHFNILNFIEAGYANFQDVYVMQK